MAPDVGPLLLIDADTNFRRALAIGLRLEGLFVEEAAAPLDARRWFARRPFGTVVIDLLLPGGDAIDLAEAARARQPDCVLVLTSAHPEAFESARRRLPGALFREKPFAVRHLIELVAAQRPIEPAKPSETSPVAAGAGR